MDTPAFVRNGIGFATVLALSSTLVACGGDGGPVDPGGDPPTLTSIAPSSGVVGNTVGVTLTGTNFETGNTDVTVSGSGVTVEGVSVASSTSLTADFVIAAGASPGDYDVTVSTDEGTSGSRIFTVESDGGGSNTVEADDNFFSPGSIEVEVGETVTWENVGNNTHTVTPDGHSDWSDTTLQSGETFQHTFDQAGTFDYVCTIHPGMSGTITVVQP